MAFWQRGKKHRDEIDAEIRSHLQMAARDRVERGEAAQQADHAARREFGNVGLVQEVPATSGVGAGCKTSYKTFASAFACCASLLASRSRLC